MMSGARAWRHHTHPHEVMVCFAPQGTGIPPLGGWAVAQPMVRCQRGGGAPGVAMAVVVAGGRSGGAERRGRWYP